MFVADDDSVQIVRLLDQTLTSIDGVAVREALDRLSTELPHFPYCLLSIASGGESPSQRIAAATYLKNFTRRSTGTEGTISEVSKEFKDQLLLALLQADPAVLKVLLELFHIVVVSEFVKKNAWPELVQELCSAIEKSSLISSSDPSWSTVNALMVLFTVVKPFQYFLQPKLVKEPVPQQLESITKEILVPLVSVLHRLVEGLTVLSIFSGIGGAEIALDRLGICLKGVVSVDPCGLSPNILKRWWQTSGQTGELVQIEEIRSLTTKKLETLMQRFREFDLVICQNPPASPDLSKEASRKFDYMLFNEFAGVSKLVRAMMGSS